MLEFLRKQDKFRIEKVYPFRVVCFPPFGEIVILITLNWKDSINFSILSSFICSFLTHFIQISLNFFFYSIVKFHLPDLSGRPSAVFDIDQSKIFSSLHHRETV